MSGPQEGGQQGEQLVTVQATPALLGPKEGNWEYKGQAQAQTQAQAQAQFSSRMALPGEPAQEEEVELASSVSKAGGGEDTVMGGGGLDDFLQALGDLGHRE